MLSFLVLSLLSVPIQAQQVPKSSETVDVAIVNLDVVVSDRSGHPVPGLTADDFEVRENRRPQPITNFAEYGNPAAATAIAASDHAIDSAGRALRERRVIVLLVDRFVLPNQKSQPMFAALRRLFHDTVEPGDEVMIVSWDRVLVRRLSFTDNPLAIDATLARIEEESSFGTGYFLKRLKNSSSFLEETTATIVPGRRYDFSDVHSLLSREDARLELRSKYEGMQSLIDSISGVEGRKILLVLADHLSRYAGLRHDPRNDMTAQVNSVVRAANANGVAVYPLYPTAMSLSNPSPIVTADRGQRRNFRTGVTFLDEREAGVDIANRTGGRTDWDAVSIAQTLPTVRKDIEHYYSLAYRAGSVGDDRERDIVVTPRNRAYHVIARRSYVDKSDARRMTERVTANLVDSRHASPSTLAVNTTIGEARRSDKDHWLIPVSIRIPVGGLFTQQTAGMASGSFSVFIASQSVIGELSDVTHRTQAFSIPVADHVARKDDVFTYDVQILADARTDRVSVGVLDDLSHDYGVATVQLPSRSADGRLQ
jgi:VWFA-related protein